MRFMVKAIWDVGKGNELARKGDSGKIAQEIRLRLNRLVLSAN